MLLNEKDVFTFELLETGQLKQGEVIRNFSAGNEWVVLVEKQERLPFRAAFLLYSQGCAASIPVSGDKYNTYATY
jgi:hypothetical protein